MSQGGGGVITVGIFGAVVAGGGEGGGRGGGLVPRFEIKYGMVGVVASVGVGDRAWEWDEGDLCESTDCQDKF